jgi:hypothetical protein
MPSGRIVEQQAGRLAAHILDADLEPHDIEGRQEPTTLTSSSLTANERP